jgi:DNA polymerase-4
VGRTVVLKLRFGDFTTITRSRTLPEHTDLARRIYDEVVDVYASTGRESSRIRLVGVRMEQLVPASEAAIGLWETAEGWREAEDAMDAVASRFGRGLVRPATLLDKPGKVSSSDES